MENSDDSLLSLTLTPGPPAAYKAQLGGGLGDKANLAFPLAV